MPNPRLARQTLEDWRDLPEESTPVKRTSLQTLEKRLAEFIYTAEAGIRKAVKEAAELSTVPAYKEAENEKGDVVYAEKEKAFYAWNATSKAWEAVTTSHFRGVVGATAEVTTPVEGDFAITTGESIKIHYYAAAAWKALVFKGTNTVTEPVKISIEKPKTGTKLLVAFIRTATGEKVFIKELEGVLVKGKATFKIKKNGIALKFEGSSETAELTEVIKTFKLEKQEELKSKDYVEIEITGETSTPENTGTTLFVEHVLAVEAE